MAYLLLMAAILGFSPAVLADDNGQAQDTAHSFAVVELFSSQGCSICPTAYDLVSRSMDWAGENNAPVYFLDFHVDYFNDKGWGDVFSNAAFTDRQKNYDHVLNQTSYTPQMVFNGRDIFNGTDQQRLMNDINHQLSLSVSPMLDVSVSKTQDQDTEQDQLLVSYTCKGCKADDELNVALVERDLSTDIKGGENTGTTLHQDDVVREFQSIPSQGNSGQATIPLEKVRDTSYASLIVYVQDTKTLSIKDAVKLDLDNV